MPDDIGSLFTISVYVEAMLGLLLLYIWAQNTDIKAVADRVYRTDIYRAAAREMNVACPETDRLPPGGHGEPLLPSHDDRSSTETKAGVACGSN